MIKIFLCHASEDKPVVRKVASDLRRFGAHVWIDETAIQAGDSLRESIEYGLEEADFVLVFLSGSSVCKTWVKKELSTALALEIDRGRKVIIPILIDECEVPLLIKDKLYVDLRRDYESGFQLLLKSSGLTEDDIYPESIETIQCLVELDIVEDDGSVVNFVKEQTVRCLQGISTGYTEAFSPDGRIDDFLVSPGTVDRIYKEAGLIYIPTKYDTPLHAGDTLIRRFSCVWYDSFMEPKEYWEQRQHHPSSDISIRVIFPERRPPKRYWAEHRHGSINKSTNLEAILSANNKRAKLELTIMEPVYLHSYLLKWEW
jgi:hypothetical protein